MTRFSVSSPALAAGLSLVAGLAAAEPTGLAGSYQTPPENRPTLAAGQAGAAGRGGEHAGWSQQGNSAHLMRNAGRGNSAGFSQSGRGNRATVMQSGNRNGAQVTQRGTGKTALVIQHGDDTDVTIDQHGEGPAGAIVVTW